MDLYLYAGFLLSWALKELSTASLIHSITRIHTVLLSAPEHLLAFPHVLALSVQSRAQEHFLEELPNFRLVGDSLCHPSHSCP